MRKANIPTTTDLRVSDILDAAPACRETTIHTVGPAAVVVFELDAPLRLETHTWSRREFDALLAALARDPQAVEILRLYFAARLDENGEDDPIRRERERLHTERLSLTASAPRM